MQVVSQIERDSSAELLERKLQSFKGPGIYSRVVNGVKIHAIISGWFKVKHTLYNSDLGQYLGLFDPMWSDWLPIFSWVIEHPEGTIVIDTGETMLANDDEYLRNTGFNGWFNKQITRFNVVERCEVGTQLNSLGIQSENVRWVILTHMHIDHTGGLKYFPKSEIILSHQEFVKPYYAVEQTHPSWFQPHLVDYFDDGCGTFEDAFVLTKAKDVIIVPTPGHTFGHQSVIYRTPDIDIFFGGDACFTYEQLILNTVRGINADSLQTKKTLVKIHKYCMENSTVYLPSHDKKSVENFFGLPVALG